MAWKVWKKDDDKTAKKKKKKGSERKSKERIGIRRLAAQLQVQVQVQVHRPKATLNHSGNKWSLLSIFYTY